MVTRWLMILYVCCTYTLTGQEVKSQRIPFMEHLATFASRPFWLAGRPQRLKWGRGSSASTKLPTLDPIVLNTSVKFAEGVVSRLARLERTLASSDVRVTPGSAAHGQYIAGMPVDEALKRHREAQVALRASQFIADNNCRKYNLKDRRCGELVNSLSLAGTSLVTTCPTRGLTCQEQSKYRTLDGTCNNVGHPSWGSALTAYRRELKAQYADGLQSPRGSSSLIGAREVSSALSVDTPRAEKDVTLAVMQWAQFISEDIAQTPAAKMATTGSSIACCKPDGGSLPPRSMHPSCSPITISGSDPVYRGRWCLDYVRSLIAPRMDCRFGPAEQMNQATHWLDASMIYGTSEGVSTELRTKTGGRMSVSTGPEGELLPLHEQPTTGCQSISKPKGPCFKSGDSRVNEQPMLTALHTIMLREHNRIATSLSQLNPHWKDEKIFQEARRLVIAEVQHITYTLWLPALLGDMYARQGTDYTPNANPAVRNSVATAALHFTFSMMSSALELHDESRHSNSTLRLRDHYNRPAVLHESGRLDQLVRSLATQAAQTIDLILTADVTSSMYAGEDGGLGMDALSLLIQRGRDHGLPGYNSFRAECGHSTAQSIDDFADLIPRTIVDQLKTVYSRPNDVDLFVGAMAERAAEEALVGPTFRCLLSRQFRDTRRADRYFYDVQEQPGSFTPEQLAEVKKTSLAQIFCENGDNILTMQPDVFHRPSAKRNNMLISCSQLSGPDLTLWRETPGASVL